MDRGNRFERLSCSAIHKWCRLFTHTGRPCASQLWCITDFLSSQVQLLLDHALTGCQQVFGWSIQQAHNDVHKTYQERCDGMQADMEERRGVLEEGSAFTLEALQHQVIF